MADTKKKQLVYNIIDFLRTSSSDGTIKEDDKESVEIAIQCLSESFGVDPDSESDKSSYSLAPANLLSLLDVYLKTKAKTTSTSTSTPAPAPQPSQAQATTSTPKPTKAPTDSAQNKKQADELKAQGNAFMSQKLYESAIEKYTEAIKLDQNPVYYSNRAAAWGGLGEHSKAVEDAEMAIELDSGFAKAYSRLGHAHFSNGDYQSAIEAYESGLKLDPSNANMKSSLATAKTRYAETQSNPVSDREPPRAGGGGGMPDLSALAGLMGGAGRGGGGGGGMPDLASLMNNPQMMQMAQQMMANGGLERLMSNPNIRNMAENFQRGGGMPDFEQMAQDPAMRDLASQFMGGGAGAGAGRGGQ